MSDSVKFLLVDDAEENLTALKALLKRDHVDLFTACSGTQALELVLAHDFALALVDVEMPEMDGFELAELMRGAERSKHVPIIFVTAGAREQNRLFKGYESGAVDFLFKPIDPHILRHKANVFFELYRQRQQLAGQVEERERLLREIRETLHFNEMFYAALGHDLRNPLNAVMIGATLLVQDPPNEEAAAVGRRILSSSSRMATMIEQLLDLARARLAGGIPVLPVHSDLRALAEKVVAEHQATAPARAISLETAGDVHGAWDESRIAQVISNLLANALQHGRSGACIRVRLDGRKPEEILLTVTNAGAIDPAIVPGLFEPFRSGRRDESHAEGLGLGLYIVDQIVKAHHGSVRLCCDEPETTTFEVRLPRVPIAVALCAPSEAAP